MLNHIKNKGVITDHVEKNNSEKSLKPADLRRFSFAGQKNENLWKYFLTWNPYISVKS